jgi:hypothetical protein
MQTAGAFNAAELAKTLQSVWIHERKKLAKEVTRRGRGRERKKRILFHFFVIQISNGGIKEHAVHMACRVGRPEIQTEFLNEIS